MSEPDSGYPRYAVNHSAGQTVDAEGRGTNAVEGLFARVKRFLRRHHMRHPQRSRYGGMFAEFLWRHQQLGSQSGLPGRKWQQAAFWRLLATLRANMPEGDDLACHSVGEASPGRWSAGPGARDRFEALIPTLRATCWAHPVQPGVVFSVVRQVPAPGALPIAEETVELGRELLWGEDEVCDGGEEPTGQSGRLRGRGRGSRGRGCGRGGARGGRRWRRQEAAGSWSPRMGNDDDEEEADIN